MQHNDRYHEFELRVRYADTDKMGVVYYANYLRWLEMARCELLADFGSSVADYAAQGVIFAVVRVEIDYHAPATLADEVEVDTVVQRVRRVRFTLGHSVRRSDGRELATAAVTLACVNPQGKLRALPAELAAELRSRAASGVTDSDR